ncbi:MAG: hypothetical protein K2H79_04605 [Bacteroidaceae bacterium]|nr:hypothetical protein [Bacteroidaceae bacterium]
MKLEKISNYSLYAVCGVIVLVFALFFGVGYDNYDESGNVAPMLTNLLLGLMYVLGLVTFCLMVWSLVKSARSAAGSDEKETTGIAGSKIVIGTAVVTVLAFVAGFVFNMGEEAFTTSSGVTTSGTMVTLVDAFMVAIYCLAIVSVIAVVVASTGVMTKTASKK